MKWMSRRDLLQALALGAGAASVLDPTWRKAHAQTVTLPRRIVFFHNPNGITPGNRYDEFASGSSPTTYQLGVLTTPLGRHRQNLVILDNLEMKKPQPQTNTHFMGLVQLLTGKYPGERPTRSTHISVDQYLAQKIGKVVTPRFPTLNLGVQVPTENGQSFFADGTPAPTQQDPLQVYRAVFENLVTGGTGTVDPALVSRLERRQSVLDNVTADLAELQKRLGPEDRLRAEAQLDAIRTLEARLVLPTAPATGCTKPAQPAAINPQDDTKLPELARAQIANIVASFACDQTRIASLMLRGSVNFGRECGFSPVNQPGHTWHALSHDQPGDGYASFRRAKVLGFELVAELCDKLQAIPEGAGTMLDNTLVFVGTEIGSSHENHALQFCTIGGKNMGVNVNRYLRVGVARNYNEGLSHTRLLVSFLRAMGLPDETFGDVPGTGSGTLPGYLRA